MALPGLIFDIQRFSIHDGPGIRTVVFFKGCPLHCAWCANPESQRMQPEAADFADNCIGCGDCLATCPRGAIRDATGGEGHHRPFSIDRSECDDCGRCAEVCMPEAKRLIGRQVTAEEVMAEVRKDTAFYRSSGGGVTLSGGEPLSQPAFSRAILDACRRAGIPTALETCGHAAFDDLASVCALADDIYFDVKVLDDEAHRRWTGVSNERILENLRRLGECQTQVVVRSPLIPGCNDRERDVRSLARLCAELPQVRALEVLPYHSLGEHKYQRLQRDYSLTGVPAQRSEDVDRLLAAAHEEVGQRAGFEEGNEALPCRVVAAFA